MVPIKRTSSERDDTSQTSLGVAGNFFKRMTPDKDFVQASLKRKVPNLGILSALSAQTPSLFGDFTAPRSIFPGNNMNHKSSFGLS